MFQSSDRKVTHTRCRIYRIYCWQPDALVVNRQQSQNVRTDHHPAGNVEIRDPFRRNRRRHLRQHYCLRSVIVTPGVCGIAGFGRGGGAGSDGGKRAGGERGGASGCAVRHEKKSRAGKWDGIGAVVFASRESKNTPLILDPWNAYGVSLAGAGISLQLDTQAWSKTT